MSSEGSTKITADSAPADEAWVCTRLFSRMLESLKRYSSAMEITAAGMADAKVRPTFSPRYTLAAVKARVIKAPSKTPRKVNSRTGVGWVTGRSSGSGLGG